MIPSSPENLERFRIDFDERVCRPVDGSLWCHPQTKIVETEQR